MATFPITVFSQAQLEEEIKRASARFGPEVVRLKYNLQGDNDGDPAIYFRIVLTDSASREESLGDVGDNIENITREEIRPYEKGLYAYFSFRSQSEQAMMNDPEWA